MLANYLTTLILSFSILVCSAQEISPQSKIFAEDTVQDGIVKTYFEGGKSLMFKGRVKDGMRQGPWIYYRTDGTVNSIVNYADDEINGPTISYDGDEIKVSETYFVNGVKEGEHREFYNDGSVALLGYFKEGKRDSTWTEFIGFKKRSFKKRYKNDQLHGESVFYFEQEYAFDKVQAVENYQYGVKDGEWKFYFLNKQLEKQFFFKNGLLDGPYVEYYRNGKKKEEGNFSFDLRSGKWLTFWEEGGLESIGDYRRDQRTGIWKFFSKSGTLRSEGPYLNDQRNGQWIYYFEDGALSAVGSYQYGEKHGMWGLFYSNDQLQQEQSWSRGRLMEVSEFYTIKGEELESGTLKGGDGSYFEYYPEGELYIAANLSGGLFEGEYTIYYTSGTKQARGDMSLGLQHGNWIYWHNNGKVESTGEFRNGEKVGRWKYYSGRGRLRDTIDHGDL